MFLAPWQSLLTEQGSWLILQILKWNLKEIRAIELGYNSFIVICFAKDKLNIFVNNDLAHQSVLFANECGNYIVF